MCFNSESRIKCLKGHYAQHYHGLPTGYKEDSSVQCDACGRKGIHLYRGGVYHCEICNDDFCAKCTQEAIEVFRTVIISYYFFLDCFSCCNHRKGNSPFSIQY